MSIHKVASVIFALILLPTIVALATAQVTEQAARQQASNVVRAELHSRLGVNSDQFLSIHRDEDLEESLAIATVGWRSGPVFIYKVSPTGVEVKDNAIVNHVATDIDLLYIVAVNSIDGNNYRIHGFGPTQSLAEFEKMITALKMHVAGPDQAESLAEFYRKVNPENLEGLTPILRLMQFKQAAEQQCQIHAKSFDLGEKAFIAWWNHAEPLYATLSFRQTAVSHGGGYLIEWIVLSSPADENCGGAPMRATLEVSSDGHLSKLSISPIEKG